MKLITLNTWGGKLYDPLVHFIKKAGKDVDIICLQEVLERKSDNKNRIISEEGWEEAVLDLYDKIKENLKGFNSNISKPYTSFGERLAIFTSKSIKLVDHGELILIRQKNMINNAGERIRIGSTLQWISFSYNKKYFTIANVHGFWNKNKDDSPERLKQSKRILDFLKSKKGAKILCGDFNLNPNTKSVKMLETYFKNLIRTYDITSTRSKHYASATGTRFADYIFASPEVKISDFKVLKDEVSDHLPILLGFE